MPALALLPLWAFIYANTLEKPPAATSGPLAEGAKIYTNCASCHGGAGEGGVGPTFQNGALGKDWPKFQDQIRWVSLGSAGWPGDTYGATNKPKKGGMPAWTGQLTPLQIAEVVRYEREVLSGLPPDPDLVAITEGTKKPLDKDGNEVAAGDRRSTRRRWWSRRCRHGLLARTRRPRGRGARAQDVPAREDVR